MNHFLKFSQLLCLGLFLGVISTSCASTKGHKDNAKKTKVKSTRSDVIESYALWDSGTRLDRDVLRRGAQTRGTNQNGY